MGYRLEIGELEYKACGGKLYGYVEDTEQLKSYKWLLDNCYIDGDEYWSYGCNPKIILRKNKFKEFIKLYNEDCNNAGHTKDIVLKDKGIQELMNSDKLKILEWG